jgi:exonuclease-1
MGITGLLPIVKGIIKKKHISKFSNSKIGIDGHAWIHQVLPSIAYEMYTKTPFKRHLEILMSKIKTLLDFKITPIFIFDGDFLESKEKTVKERAELRKKAHEEVEFFIKRNDMGKARELMKRCVSVTPDVLVSILQLLKSNDIEYFISPYEADAQLYFLQKIGYIDHILTEDSDLIVYGSHSVLYKYSGTHVDVYDSKDLHLAKDLHFKENILDICILSGCDYVDSIRGVGLITAHKLLKEKGDVISFVQHMAANKKEVPADYLEEFDKAKRTFLHHIVYNPSTGKRQFLTEPVDCCAFLGTLENLPFRFSKIEMDRHFVPEKRFILQMASVPVKASSEECEIDLQETLPYFK